MTLPAGAYQITGLPETRDVLITRNFRETVVFKLALGHLVARSQCGGEGDLNYSLLNPQGQVVATGAADEEGIDLAPGLYEIMLNRYPNVRPRSVEVVANRINRVQLGTFGSVTVDAFDAAGKALHLPLLFFDDEDRHGSGAEPVIRGETGSRVILPVGRYNVYVGPESALASTLSGRENIAVSTCQHTTQEIRQRAALYICGDSGQAVVYDDRTGEELTANTHTLVGVQPSAFYNIELPDGKWIYNHRAVEGVNRVNCP